MPSGWWHVILNMDLTVAVTQNYASTANFMDVWAATAKSRPRLASHWLAAIEQVSFQWKNPRIYQSGILISY